mgnify:CR=1 FL=1
MTAKVVKSTSKGQITLPNEWRKKFQTKNFILEVEDKILTVKPINLDMLRAEEVIFDAERDNDGKGISLDAMIKVLKKIRNE